MRIIARKTLINFWKRHRDAEQALRAWFVEVKNSKWTKPNELKSQYGNASIITKKRVVFNIKGNDYRLITDIEYKLQIVFIVWIGTHKNYSKINVKKISYGKTNKK